MPDAHAKLSASGAELWMNCPGSQHMKDIFPDSTSIAAQEGTHAHSLAEMLLGGIDPDNTDLPKRIKAFHKDNPEADSYSAMLGSLVDYIAFVNEEKDKADEAAKGTSFGKAELFRETRVDFSEFVPGGFGTADVMIVSGDVLHVIDLKYGKGVAINAVNNPQIRLYGLGALEHFALDYDIKTIRMTIYQPRLDYVTSEEMSAEDLRAWGETVIKPAAEKAAADTREYHPGEWCKSHFCPAVGQCRARKLVMDKYLKARQEDPDLLSPEELGDILKGAKKIKSWISDLEKTVTDIAIAGIPVPGWKIVEGRSNRIYTDPDLVALAVKKEGFPEAMIYEKKLLGVTAMEKLMGKKTFKAALENTGLVIKPKGSPTLALESDARPQMDLDVTIDDFT